jgi:hypothetical protein
MRVFRLRLLISVAAVAAMIALLIFRYVPVDYTPTAASGQWLTYHNDELGFEIKYPSDLWRREQEGNRVVFRPSWDDRHFDIVSISGVSRADKGRKIRVNGIDGREWTANTRYFDNAGAEEYEICSLQSGTDAYELRWTLGRESRKYSGSVEADFREMIGTFRLTEIKHSDYLTYSDPSYHFSVSYPNGWQIGCAHGSVLIRYKSGANVSIFFRENTTFAQYAKSQGKNFEKVGDVQECFENHLIGRRCLWLDDDTYAFEKGGGVYMVKISTRYGTAPNGTVEAILNSLRL